MFNTILPAIKTLESEGDIVCRMLANCPFDSSHKQRIEDRAVGYVEHLRSSSNIPMIERMMNLYSLSSVEGRVLMELTEALLRTPDALKKRALIEEKLPNNHWFSTQSALHLLSGTAMGVASVVAQKENILKQMINRLGMPAVRECMRWFMQRIGKQFVLAESIEAGITKANVDGEKMSFDMLGEGARDERMALDYLSKYESAIHAVGKAKQGTFMYDNHGISVKLTALYGQYNVSHHKEVFGVMFERLEHLVRLAKHYQINFTLDAEEDARLELAHQMMYRILEGDICDGWDGFGTAMQSYQLRTEHTLRLLYEKAKKYNRRIHVRLVKGAYWDHEIKIAQQKGLGYFPVFTHKRHSDISYIHLANQLLDMTDCIYPMFATHNAYTMASIQELIEIRGVSDYEFQRLQGLGEELAQHALAGTEQFSRVYAPIGGSNHLLAYLVRRLLENGANSSFINRLHQQDVSPQMICEDPFSLKEPVVEKIRTGYQLYPDRKNSHGTDLDDPVQLFELIDNRQDFMKSCVAKKENKGGVAVRNPANPEEVVGYVQMLDANTLQSLVERLHAGKEAWSQRTDRGTLLLKVADLYEEQFPQFSAILCREAGKTISDAEAEVREAVDFLRYYAKQGEQHKGYPRGVALCIAPWNFPLAIFTGQMAAALATGNTVITKPSQETSLVASMAVALFRQAGIDESVLQLAITEGAIVSSSLIEEGLVDMVAFTGSTEAGQAIVHSIAQSPKPEIPLIAETGGLNAMIVDSSSLIERAADDIIRSAFQSAGQRCSALRLLLVDEAIDNQLIRLLKGMGELQVIGNPADTATDIGPLISQQSQANVLDYIQQHSDKIIWQGKKTPQHGYFVPPTLLRLQSISELKSEVFAPVLHLITYKSGTPLGELINQINALGYGLTFGIHGRLYQENERLAHQCKAGNVYLNRDIIGAVVETQPFGGSGLSGTGPKAGGPLYLSVYQRNQRPTAIKHSKTPSVDGESNDYSTEPRGNIGVFGRIDKEHPWCQLAQQVGNRLNFVDDNTLDLAVDSLDALMMIEQTAESIASARKILMKSQRIVPLIIDEGTLAYLYREKHVSTNTTASGGDMDLLSKH